MIERQCPVCGCFYFADSNRLKWGRQTTCSRVCSYEFRAKEKRNSIQMNCAYCNKLITRSPSQLKSKHGSVFCSLLCHFRGRSAGLTKRIVTSPYNVSESARDAWRKGAQKTVQKRRLKGNYGHTESSRAKLSAATSQYLVNNNKLASSKLERRVKNWLEQFDINFIHQYPFRNDAGRFWCVVDFYFPDFNVAMEVNGTYWHADPRFYPNPINDMQKRCVNKYNRKIDLLQSMGVNVVEVWEADLRSDFEETLRIAYAKASGAFND